MKRFFSARYIPLIGTIVVFLALYLTGVVRYPGMRTLYAFLNLFGDYTSLGIAAIGMTFVILSGGIDLSVGSMTAFTGMLVARAVAEPPFGWGLSPFWAIAFALAVGVAFGASQGCLIQFFELPPFLVTLAGMFFARGMAFVIHEQSIPIRHPFFLKTVNNDLTIWFGPIEQIRFVTTCFLVVFVMALVVGHYTRFGRNVYALGGNEQSATLMGLPVGRTKISVYALAGLCSAVAGVILAMDQTKGDPLACVGLELYAIASVVIGGTLLTGGVGYVTGTLVGVLVYSLIKSLIDFQGDIDAAWTSVAIGGLLFGFILLQKSVEHVNARRRSDGP